MTSINGSGSSTTLAVLSAGGVVAWGSQQASAKMNRQVQVAVQAWRCARLALGMAGPAA